MSEETTVVLALPLIQPAQAQKHVTHNEAMRLLDLIVQLSVESRSLTVPPASPAEAERHIVPTGATGAWAGQAGRIAVQTQGAWEFLEPAEGWQAFVRDEGQMARRGPGGWTTMAEETQRMAALGIAADADAQNRLSVSAPATLFNHAGGGHQVKLNKAAPAETASLLYQTGFSGRAEMGLAGTDAFSVKVSADGTTWTEAMVVAPGSGVPVLPQGVGLAAGTAALPALHFAADAATGLHAPAAGQIGFSAAGATRMQLAATQLQVNVPVAGTAVTQSTVDPTAGRLMKVGDFGLGGTPPNWPTADLNDTAGAPSGLYYSGTALNRPAGAGWVLQGANGATNGWQWFFSITQPGQAFYRARSAAGWSAWARLYSAQSVLGAVSQSGGVPAGALIERGSNANGDYVRFADGTQLCTVAGLSSASVDAARGALFRSPASVGWTFPAAFSTAPVLQFGPVSDADCWIVGNSAATVTAASVRVMSAVTKPAAVTFGLTATGRWF